MRTDKRYRILLLVGQYKNNNNTWIAANNSEEIHSLIQDRMMQYPRDTWFKAIVYSNTGFDITPSFINQGIAIAYKTDKPKTIIFVKPDYALRYLTNAGTYYFGLNKLVGKSVTKEKPF